MISAPQAKHDVRRSLFATGLLVLALLFASTAIAGVYASSGNEEEPEPVPVAAKGADSSEGRVHVFWYNDFEVNITTDEEIVYVWVEFCIDATAGYQVDGLQTMVHHEEEVVVAVTVRIMDQVGIEETFRYVSPNKEEVCNGGPEPTPTASPEPTPTGSPDPTPTPSPEPTPTGSPDPTPTSSPEPTPTSSPEPTPTGSPEPTPTGSPEPTPTASPEPTPTGSPEPTPTSSPEPTPTGSPGDGNGCNPSLQAWNDGDTIVLSWTERENATEYRLYRNEADTGFEPLATVDADTTRYRDHNVTEGTTYTYQATAVVNGTEATPCNQVEITKVPFFVTATAAVLAAVSGVAAYWVGRRRAG